MKGIINLMKKLITGIVFLAIIVLACFGLYQSVLGPFSIDGENINYDEYEKLYYYNQLTSVQKEMYIKMDNAINNLETTIVLGLQEKSNNKSDIYLVFDAIYKDRPEYYFLPNQYNVRAINLFDYEYVYIQMEYDVKDLATRKIMDTELENAIQQILYDTITEDMTIIQKQIAIHDKLVEQVNYYEYENIEEIPNEKHTAYGALVQKEAVCDGISKAMMLLLNRVGIQTIIVSGNVDGVSHAWNIISIDGEYYHLDATSDRIKLDSKKYVAHNYFNITDEQIKITHGISDEYTVPNCNGEKYNYYIYNDYNIDYLDNMKNRIRDIINRQKGRKILELKIDKLYTSDDLIEAMYFANYNNWYTDKKTSVSYHNFDDIYIFENNNK